MTTLAVRGEAAMKICYIILAALALSGCVEQEAHKNKESVRLATYSAALATTVTYCQALDQNVGNQQVKSCFDRAKNVLDNVNLDSMSVGIYQDCLSHKTFDTCITPKIGSVVNAIHSEFHKEGIVQPIIPRELDCENTGEAPVVIDGRRFVPVKCKG